MMHRLLLVLGFLFSSDIAFGQPAEPAESTSGIWTLGGFADGGFVAKRRSTHPASNLVLNLGIGFLVDLDVSSKWRLGLGIGLPSANIAPNFSVPLSARFFPFGATNSGVYLQGQLVPTFALGTPCAFGQGCDIPRPSVDANRLYRVVGVIGKTGVGFQINFQPVWIYTDIAVSTAVFKALRTNDGYKMEDGFYWGGEFTMGFRIPF